VTAVRAAATTWQVDTARSTAAFLVGNLGVRQVRGTVPVVSGTVCTDADGRVAGLRAVVDATGVDTRNSRRDRDLRGPGLLGVEQAPTWSFVSVGVEPDGEGWRVTGVLTVRRPCPVVLAVEPAAPLPDGGLRVRARTTLDRRDAGVQAPRVLVGRRVEVELDVVLRRAG
jgi:polyisoprenoid-binding protein YceI